jgi:hypothetical protein
MQRQSALTWLVPLIAILVVITAGMGLFTFTFNRQTVEMYGRRIYLAT